jgi:hypothetical protein
MSIWTKILAILDALCAGLLVHYHVYGFATFMGLLCLCLMINESKEER